MSVLNASNSSIGLSFKGSLFESTNALDREADQTVEKTSTHFAEVYNSGWRTDFQGSFSNYQIDSDVPGSTVEYPTSALVSSVTLAYQGTAIYTWTGLAWNPMIGSDDNTEQAASMLAGNDSIFGSMANDVLAGFAGNDSIDGGTGRDEADFFGARTGYSVAKSGANGWTVSGGSDGTDTLSNIERIKFTDKSIALDVDTTGNAGQAMELIGVLAPTLLNDLNVRGVIISLFDQGYSMLSLSQLALDSYLLPTSSNAALANAVYKNVVGTTASQEMTNALADYITGHGMAEFVATIAGMHINVDLVGLQQTGLEYI